MSAPAIAREPRSRAGLAAADESGRWSVGWSAERTTGRTVERHRIRSWALLATAGGRCFQDDSRDGWADRVADLEDAAAARPLPGVAGSEALEACGLLEGDPDRAFPLRGRSLPGLPIGIAVAWRGCRDQRRRADGRRRAPQRPFRRVALHGAPSPGSIVQEPE